MPVVFLVTSANIEVEQNGHDHVDRGIADTPRRETPLASGGDGFAVQARIE